MRIFGGRRREAMRRKGSAAAAAPQKNLILPQDNSRKSRCLQFAARLVGAVNVRDLRESQTSVKCFPRCRISSRMMRRAFCTSPSHASQAVEQPSESPRSHGDCSRCTAQPLPPTRFSAPNDALRSAKRRRLPSVCRNVPSSCRKTPLGSRVIGRCALSTSTGARFRRDRIPQS
jgi:hypothetical protein